VRDNTYGFIKKVIELVGKYDHEVSAEEVGQSAGAFYMLTIKDAGVEVKIKAGRCIIRDINGNSTQFEKLRSDEWEQESLDYIHAILK